MSIKTAVNGTGRSCLSAQAASADIGCPWAEVHVQEIIVEVQERRMSVTVHKTEACASVSSKLGVHIVFFLDNFNLRAVAPGPRRQADSHDKAGGNGRSRCGRR